MITRTQPTKLKTEKKQKVFVLLAFALLIMVSVILLTAKLIPDSFKPPEFDDSAVEGTPSPDQNYAYDKIDVENGFSFSVAGSMYQQEDGSVFVYLTNPQNSDYVLKGEILDKEGNILYRSGAIKSGFYVKRLKPIRKIENKAIKVEMKIYAFEKDTWYSRGTISLTNTLQPW